MRVRAVLAAVALLVLVVACSDDDDDAGPVTEEPVGPVSTTASPEPATGGIDVPDLPGTFAAPVPSLGFGIAVPEGWDATLLSETALQRLEEATLARPSFLEAARRVAASGAVFYAAGVDEDGRVAELKVDVQDGADTGLDAVRDLAESVAAREEVVEATVVEDEASGRVRVDYRAPVPSAEDGEVLDTYGSQLFVPDGDRLWSLIVTSEDRASQTALVDIFAAGLTFD